MSTIRGFVLLGALLYGVLFLTDVRPAHAQMLFDEQVDDTYEPWPAAQPEDVESIDAIITTLYAVISGPRGELRDWDRFRSLFIPQAHFIPSSLNESGDVEHNFETPDQFANRVGAMVEEAGFFEIETARTTERFGHIAHAFSTYATRRNETDVEPFTRGINSIQLLHNGERWYIVNIFWTAERPDLPLPERYKSSRPRR